MLSRRQVVGGALAAAAGLRLPSAAAGGVESGLPLGPAMPFDLERVATAARALAAAEWRPAVALAGDVLHRIDFDLYQQIRFRKDRTLRLGSLQGAPVQLFHLGNYFVDPVKIYLVDGAEAREALYRPDLFELPESHPARGLPEGLGFAGFRVMASDLLTDWLAFLGASYFRSSGPYNQYGLSARALAIDTAMPTPEEFPRFTEFWLEPGASGDSSLIVTALLDSPSVAGAYRMTVARATDSRDIHRVSMEIDARIFARRDVGRLGVAPFSSMFWYGEASRKQAADWRPEIHDSDGLAIWTGSGERIWRPLNNPSRVMTSTFIDRDIKGFGLLQRDRDFVHYLDDGVFYERRPSVWVEPLEGWGEGALHLVEIPTDDEIHDNIVAYWCPVEPLRAGDERRYRYRLTWLDDIPNPQNLGQAMGTFTGLGGRPGYKRPDGVRKFVVDFQGAAFAGLGRDDGVEAVITLSRGEAFNVFAHPVVDQHERWRMMFDASAVGPEPLDMRAFLRRGDKALTETWVYQYFPQA
jgi:glucans biosynthesis protein